MLHEALLNLLYSNRLFKHRVELCWTGEWATSTVNWRVVRIYDLEDV